MERDRIEGYFFGEGEGLEETNEEATLRTEPDQEELMGIAEETPEESDAAANRIYNEVLDEMFPMRKGANKKNLASRFGHSRN